jgi:hypothetical protein
MSDSASYLVDGKQLSADQCRTMFGGMSLPERQSKVLERLEGRTIVDVGCHTGLSGPGMSYAWTPQTLLTLLKVNGFAYVDHCYENGMRNPIGRWFLAALPFLGPTQILKVRKVAAAAKLV